MFRAGALDGRVSDADLKGQGRGLPPSWRSGTSSGFQPAIVRAHSRASVLLAMPGNSRRCSTAASETTLRLVDERRCSRPAG